MTATITAQTAVLGLGAWGSAALWRLAERGVDTVGVEQYAVGHALGSTHGRTRLFRIACQEHPGLTPIARKSLELWTQLGERGGAPLVDQIGCLESGRPASEPVAGATAAAETAGVSLRRLDHAQLVDEYPAYRDVPADDVAVLDPGAGVCYPERFVHAQVDAARRAGARVFDRTGVAGIESDPQGITLHTAAADIRVQQLVIAAGVWVSRWRPELPLRPLRRPLFWFRARPGHEDDYRIERFPPFIRQLTDGRTLWGHGSSDDFEIKIGFGGADEFEIVDPDAVPRGIRPREDAARLSAAIAEAFPDIDPVPTEIDPCLTTHTPDEQFIIGPAADDPRIIVAGGDSGHGAKHAAGIGELLAQIAVGEPTYTDIGFVDPVRFTV